MTVLCRLKIEVDQFPLFHDMDRKRIQEHVADSVVTMPLSNLANYEAFEKPCKRELQFGFGEFFVSQCSNVLHTIPACRNCDTQSIYHVHIDHKRTFLLQLTSLCDKSAVQLVSYIERTVIPNQSVWTASAEHH